MHKMKIILLLSCWVLLRPEGFAQSFKKLHQKAIVVDTHNDVLSSWVLAGKDISKRLTTGHTDLVRWKEGGLDVQFFSVYTGPDARNKEGVYKDANEQIDSLERIVKRNSDRMVLAKNYRDVKKGLQQKKLVALIGVEGGHMIENDIQKLEALYQRGMRYMTLTWNNSTKWASSAKDETAPSKSRPKGESSDDYSGRKGLSDFGKQIVRRMNDLGIIVDLSHTGEQTFYDALAATTKPALLSHSSVWNICPVFRNVKDDQIKALALNGGVMCINFYSGFISKEYDQRSSYLDGPGKKFIQDSLFRVLRDSTKMKAEWQKYYDAEMNKVRPTLTQVIDHIDYVVKLVGDDYLGIGSDFDGVSSLPVGLEDVTTYPKITDELMRRGYSKKSVRKILGGNVLRVMKANFK